MSTRMRKKPWSGIVKVQLSIGTTHRYQQVLIYNQDHTIMWQEEADADMRRLLGGEQKAYFYAHLDDGEIVIGDAAPEQEW